MHSDVIKWYKWKSSEEGKRCLIGSAAGEYLENRLWFAFMAGMTNRESNEDTIKSQALRLHPCRTIKCPWCAAGIGKPCKNRDGYPRNGYHTQRVMVKA